jgi:hypothetical protein
VSSFWCKLKAEKQIDNKAIVIKIAVIRFLETLLLFLNKTTSVVVKVIMLSICIFVLYGRFGILRDD